MSKRFPRYPSDSDYQTNAPSYYDDLARKQILIETLSKRIWDYDLKIKEYFKRWENNLATINKDVIKMMINWLNDGILSDILNEEIMNKKPEIFLDKEEPKTNFTNVYWFKEL